MKLYGKQFSTQQMGVQVSCSIHAKVSKEDRLLGDARGHLDIIRDLCKWKGVVIIKGKVMPDHIHLLLSIPPKYSVSSFMGYLKGKSAMMIFERHTNLKYRYGNRHFWVTEYYVSTVGLQEKAIRKYIQEQEKQDQIEDKVSSKEHENPFKGKAR